MESLNNGRAREKGTGKIPKKLPHLKEIRTKQRLKEENLSDREKVG